MKTAVEIFTELGERLAAFGKDAHSYAAIERAVVENPWFFADEIVAAVEALRCDMLQRDKLQQWLSAYRLPARVPPKRVAVIMAGNIPLVGFFDLLCVLSCGCAAIVKPSGKDRILMHYIIELLREIEPQIEIEECGNEEMDSVKVDAVIATGNDNARRYFRSVYAGIPHLLRGNRHSVAVLSGKESDAELELLKSDIFCYSGLGCRNVSMVFVPIGYKLHLSGSPVNPKYRNNYLQNAAVLRMKGAEFTDSGSSLFVKGDDFSSSLSVVTVREYQTLAEVNEWLAIHDDELQCVVSGCIEHSRRVGFGQSQHPGLTDYPDAVDVMAFLCEI